MADSGIQKASITGDVLLSSMITGIDSALLKAIMSQVPVGLTIASAHEVEILKVSDYGSKLVGETRDVLEGIAVERHTEAYHLYDPATGKPAEAARLPLTRATLNGETIEGEEWLIVAEDGRKIPILCNAGPIRNQSGTIVGGIIAWADLSRQKHLEAELRQAIADRDTAYRELNHRVRNHLALVAAMVRLEGRDAQGEAARIASAIGLKVSALAVAYSAMEESGSNVAPAGELLRAVCKPLATAEVKIEVSAGLGLEITSQQTALIGIIVNEAVCNAIKHGFPGGESGTIEVSLRRTPESYELVVSNDGRPLTAGPRKKGSGKGSMFIESLVRQLGGTATLKDRDPTGVVLTVSVPARLRP